MRAAHSLLTLLLLGLACVVQAQSAPPPAQDAKAEDAGSAATPAADAKPADSAPNAAAQAPAIDVGLPGREGELVPQLPRLVGEEEVAWLEAEGQRFFVFKRAPRPGKTVRGSLVLVPAPQAFIDQLAVTRALREDPLTGGYHTFALQPALAAEASPASAPATEKEPAAKADDTSAATNEPSPPTEPQAAKASATDQANAGARTLCARLRAVIALATAQEPRAVAVVAEQQHAATVLACLAENFPPDVHAVAAVGTWRGEWPKLPVPSIEFVPTADPVARREAARRARAPVATDGPPRKQVEVDGRLEDAAIEIARRLRGWLDRLPAAAEPKDEKRKTVSG